MANSITPTWTNVGVTAVTRAPAAHGAGESGATLFRAAGKRSGGEREVVNRAGRMAWEGGESRTTGSGRKGRRGGERDRDD